MNPLTNVKNIQKLNERVLQMGVEDGASWHKQYKDSAYIFMGGLPYDLTEGDVLCVFSQYGEIVDVNLVRDKSSGKPKGYGFLCYEDQRSTILAVDNLNGIKLGGRVIRVDHVANYKRPKGDERDEKGERMDLPLVGCAPTVQSDEEPDEENDVVMEPKKKKRKKEKAKKRMKEKKKTVNEEVEEREPRERSPSVERKNRKIERNEKELGGRSKKLGSTSEMDRKSYGNERDYRNKMNKVDTYEKHEYREKVRDTDRRGDPKYKGNNEERIKHRRDKDERCSDKDTERKRYQDRSRR